MAVGKVPSMSTAREGMARWLAIGSLICKKKSKAGGAETPRDRSPGGSRAAVLS